MRLADKLFSLANIHHDERRIVVLMLIHSFFMGLSRMLIRVSAFALFVTEFNAQNLPYVYIAASLAVMLTSSAYLALSKRMPFLKLLYLNLVFLLTICLLIWGGLELSGLRWVKFMLPIWYEIVWTLTGLEFWGVAGYIFDVRQGERLFGLLGFGEQFAYILTGFLNTLLVHYGGTTRLFLFAGAMLGGMLWSLVVLRSNSPLSDTVQPPKHSFQQTRRTSSLFTTRYVLLIFSLIMLAWMSYFFHENLFYRLSSHQFPNEDQLAIFTGIFFAITSLLTSVVTIVFVGAIIKHYGLKLALLIMPVLLTASTIFMVGLGMTTGETILLFWLITLTFSLHRVLLYSVERSGLSLLYQPFDSTQRIQVQTAAEGIMYPLALGSAGVLLLLFTNVFVISVLGLVGILCGISILRTGVVRWLGHEYPWMLQRALSKRRLDSIS